MNESNQGGAPNVRGVGRRSRARFALQALGFVVGLGLLGWCVGSALTPDNRHHLEKLGSADWRLIAWLGVLSGASLVVNALAFWVVVRPARRVPLSSAMAVNALATALANLPFKVSALCRFVVHHRRDGVPVLTIAAWMAGVLVTMLITVGPVVVASVWRGRVDGLWCAAAGGGVLALAGVVVGLARLGRREAVWDWAARRLEGREGRLAARVELLARVKEGVAMLSSGRGVLGACGLRALDLAIQAGRFVAAASILERPISAGEAMVAAALYFMVGVASPAGALGFREAAVVGAGTVAAGTGDPVLVLTITAVDGVVVVGAALASGAYLRIDRYFLGRGERGGG